MTNKGQLNPNDDRVADAAELYWSRSMKVESVARQMGISRATASRLLARAREEGVVEFIIHREHNSIPRLEKLLRERFHVISRVVDTGNTNDKILRRLTVGKVGAGLMETLIRPGMTLAVAWGRTVEAMSLQLIAHPVPGMQVLQLQGFGDSSLFAENYVTQILTRFGNAFSASVHLLPLPAVFNSEDTKRLMYQESSIQKILTLRGNLDMVVTSVGTPVGPKPSPLFSPGILTENDVDELHKEKVIGNLASTFFREDGSTDGISVNRRSTGLNRSQLFKVPKRLFIVADADKAAPLRVALNAGFITHLVVDQATAEKTLNI